jgi:hypothetical protein
LHLKMNIKHDNFIGEYQPGEYEIFAMISNSRETAVLLNTRDGAATIRDIKALGYKIDYIKPDFNVKAPIYKTHVWFPLHPQEMELGSYSIVLDSNVSASHLLQSERR